MEQRHIMEDITPKKPDGATDNRALTGIGFNLLVGDLSRTLEFIDYAI